MKWEWMDWFALAVCVIATVFVVVKLGEAGWLWG